MKTLHLSIIIILLVISVISLSHTAEASGSISLNPSTGPLGTLVKVTGSSFASSSGIHIVFDSIDVTPSSHPKTSAKGIVSTTFTVPRSLAGSHTVTVTDSAPTPNSASASFFKVYPTIFLSPSSGTAGTTITITGYNFAPSHAIRITDDGDLLSTTPVAKSNIYGSFTVTFKVPLSDDTGTNAITASDGINHTYAIFTVTTPFPQNGLVGEWKFENNVLDTSGNNNNGVTSDGVSFVPGKVGQAIIFDGTGIDRVPISSTLNFGVGSFSISTWVKTTQTSIGYIVEHRTNNDGVYAGYSLEGQNGPGNLIGRIRDSSGNEVYVNTDSINDNQFHHIVFVVDRSIQTSKMYVDGNLVSSADISSVGNIDQNSIGVDIGNTSSPNTSNGPFVGQVDQLRIYNRALSQSDVTSLFNERNVAQNVLFQDDYSSNSGWTQLGTTITVNSPSYPGIVKWNNETGNGGTGDDRVYKQLPITLPSSNWTAYFDYQFSASSLVRSWVFDLSSTSSDPAVQDPSHIVMVEHGFSADQLMIDRGWTGPHAISSAGIPISPNTQYYVKLERVPTQLILSVFSDPARTVNVPGSPVTLDITPTDYNNNLNFIQHAGCSPCGPGRTLTAQIDNTVIFTP